MTDSREPAAPIAPYRTLRGSCVCEAVRYSIPDEFCYALLCHCSQCRQVTDSAFKPFGGIERAKLRVTQGTSHLMLYGNETNHDARCKLCGSLLYSLVRDGQYVHVTYGTLLDVPSLVPTAHIFVRSKAPWYTIMDNLPQHDEFV